MPTRLRIDFAGYHHVINKTVNITTKIFTYTYKIFNNLKYYSCCKESILLQEFDIKTLSEFLNIAITEEELKILNQKQKVKKENNEIKILKVKKLDDTLYEKRVSSKEENMKNIA